LEDLSEVNKGIFTENREYISQDAVEYLDQSYDLEEEIISEEKKTLIEKKDMKKEEIFLDVNLKEDKLLQAVIYSEILGKPKAKRRRRW
jgi:hypothetical protein